MRIHHVALSIRDLEKSVKFYKDIFGFTEVKRFEKPDGTKAAFLKLDNTMLELFQFANKIDNKDDLSNIKIIGIKHIAFAVKNVDEKYKEITFITNTLNLAEVFYSLIRGIFRIFPSYIIISALILFLYNIP